ncbi:MAG: phosphoglycerate transporter [Dehalococcoidia bacterium]|nr:phosphoglycerate transporter [Dehalococcoidia bacterium]
MTLKLGWFTTRGASSRKIYEAVQNSIQSGELDAEISFVFSNRAAGFEKVTDDFFEKVKSDGIELVTHSSIDFRRQKNGKRSENGTPLPSWREEYDQEIERLISKYNFDIGVLAGYMLILSKSFVEKFPLINLHPALPDGPIGTWQEVIQELILSDARKTGLMIHRATAEVDLGPVLATCEFTLDTTEFYAAKQKIKKNTNLDKSELFKLIREETIKRESPFVTALLQEIAQGQITIQNISSQTNALLNIELPVDLTLQVEKSLTEN